MSIERNSFLIGLLGGTLWLAAPPGMAAEQEATPDQVVSTLEGTFGIHPGERRNHIKGTCAAGEFIGLPEAARAYTRSALFSGRSVPVVARFSLAGGNPGVPDTAKIPRGMALEFRLPDGSLQHMTMLNTPVFGAATPQTFFDDIVARKPDPATGKPDPERIKAFRASHPDSLPQAEFLAENNPPVSWANSSYFGVHTFKFVSQDNKTTLIRWRFVPRDGEKQLSDDELRSASPSFLEDRLIERTERGPVRWDMIVTIGNPGDPEDNPTRLWPSNRKEIKMGTLMIVSAMSQEGAECKWINFNPLVMADGIEPTKDPILLFRSPVYGISFGKRLSGK
ncbi:catalase family peroxidase [Nitrosomonas sp.]|uniref:catalase family peroxidase n=1 Tax=Nitrosomonas sp. TaxID=42353 RepID=UPI0025F3F86A|nr:catalase family peroxidase [Nitrosomonas sp.]MCC6917155.1 catalase family peroxidase [Nitrosomonas sp.]